jgi:transcriptional regulator with XRE-family HTH domain
MGPNSTSDDFAHVFGDALDRFLKAKGLSRAAAARQIGLDTGSGKARLGTYCHDSTGGKRAKPDAEILFEICVKLGFTFEYRGYQISASSLSRDRKAEDVETAPTEQLKIQFHGQIDLTQGAGEITIKLKHASGSTNGSYSLSQASTRSA